MQEVVIKYNNPDTLKLLKGLSKYFGFVISKPKVTKKEPAAAHSTIIPGDASIDITALNEIFTGTNINPKELREKVWRRQK